MLNSIKSIYGNSEKQVRIDKARKIAEANRSIYGNSNVDVKNREDYLAMAYHNIK